jgi:hypothetical protein
VRGAPPAHVQREAPYLIPSESDSFRSGLKLFARS